MPECYEVFRMADYLRKNGVENCQITSFTFLNKGERILKNSDISTFKSYILNKNIQSIQTKAKFTFLQLSSGVLEWHYRFTGVPHLKGIAYNDSLQSIYTLPINSNTTQNNIRFSIKLSNELELNFVDTRCLSHMKFYPDLKIADCPSHKKLSPDIRQHHHVLQSELNRFPNKRLKQFLLDQHTSPSGIGNYLACEICAYAGILPATLLKKITKEKQNKINKAIKIVHNHAKASSAYSWFKVFNQTHCKSCKNPIKKEKLSKSEQSTHWCTNCQK